MNPRIIGSAIIAVVLIGVGAYFVASQKNTGSASKKIFVLTITGKQLEGGMDKLTVDEGDTVVLRITSDEAEEFHLHGYDRSVDLVPQTEITLELVANASGRFPFELEHSKTELGSLEVIP